MPENKLDDIEIEFKILDEEKQYCPFAEDQQCNPYCALYSHYEKWIDTFNSKRFDGCAFKLIAYKLK